MVFLKSFALSFITSVFAAFYYAKWYCSSFSRLGAVKYSKECYEMTRGLAPMSRAFMLLLPITFIIFFILFKLLKGKVSNVVGRVTFGIFVVGLIIILYSIGILRFPL